MPRQVRCECGYSAVGETDDEVIAAIREHLASDHPDLSGTIADDQIRGWIELV